jgi:hypothetical protein
MDNRYFIAFFEAEGSFIDAPRKASKNDPKYYPRYNVGITQKETYILFIIQKYLLLFEIKSKLRPQGKCHQLIIEDKKSLYNICKFFDEQIFETEHKKKQFEEWKIKAIKWFESGYKRRQYKL